MGINGNQKVIPGASRLIQSLRDVGYDFSTSLADVIDNSISAGASKIDIDIRYLDTQSYVRIIDNGSGMGKDDLIEALRFGSQKEYKNLDNLGKFGLGLKTASISQCRKLTVASKHINDEQIFAYCWDIDHVIRTNSWEVLEPDRATVHLHIENKIPSQSGTIVIWQNLDRIINLTENISLSNSNKMLALCLEAETYLGVVFHRFLEGKVDGKKISIYINGNAIEPWDPFCLDEINTIRFPEQPIQIDHHGKQHLINIRSYVLPTKERFSSPEAWRKAAGIKDWNSQQGLYIYRANRLIQNGGWNQLRTKDEHTKYARVAVDFSTDLDEEFKINISKMQVYLPKQIRESLKIAIMPVINKAKEVYKGKLQLIFPPKPTIEKQRNSDINNSKILPTSIPFVHSGLHNKPEYFDKSEAIDIPRTHDLSLHDEKRVNDDFLWKLSEIKDALHSVALCSEENRIINALFSRLRSKKGI